MTSSSSKHRGTGLGKWRGICSAKDTRLDGTVIRRLMRLMRLVPIYQTPNTSKKHTRHKVYPYLLGKLTINRPNQVWCTDITYIPMRKGFLYLVAVMDWYSRKALSWRLSNTMEIEFCTEALKEALARYGPPEIFNTDQGSQFTSHDFIKVLKDADVKISMDGKGRWIDNRMIERLWRSLKYECVYLRAFETGLQAKQDIGEWISYYNTERPHLSCHMVQIIGPPLTHQGKMCCGRTPLETMLEGKEIWKEKFLDQT